MNILILGADGYLGWPTSMYFSKRGHVVTAVDNYFRRNIGSQLDAEPLFPTPNLLRRSRIWKELSGRDVNVILGDITNYAFVLDVFRKSTPDVVVHYAEQPSAPYSMMNRDTAAYTLQNNLIGTLNIAHAVREVNPSCHIVKLGTMGEYGTPNIDIEEGWLEIEHKGRRDKFLFPRQASSVYHTSKIHDTDLLWFYVRTWGIRVTDLMQGPVYGIETDEVGDDERLRTFFNYDEIFGTVINRFIVQAVAGYPLTVYGTGGQTRGYLNIRDTMQCVYLAATNPPGKGELRVYNQVTETFSVNELAERVCEVGKGLALDVRIKPVENPRKEKEDHYYKPVYTGLMALGLKPHYLTNEVLADLMKLVLKHKDTINRDAIFRGVRWS